MKPKMRGYRIVGDIGPVVSYSHSEEQETTQGFADLSIDNRCLYFLRDASRRGERTVLITITGVVETAARATGTHMAVSEHGGSCGSLSGGCVEAAVIAEAHRILATGKAELVRFGAGSPYIDVRLPCGGGLDLLFTPEPDAGVIDHACAQLDQRQPVTLCLGPDGSVISGPDGHTGWHGDRFVTRYDPPLRLFLVGQGEEVTTATALALGYGAEIVVLTPDEAVAGWAKGRGVPAHRLKTPARSPHLTSDEWSAILFLFHDHDWESALLDQALEQSPFFIGAMGSPRTHAQRLDALRALGVGEAALARITGPVGLIPATRDPATLALSALAQIVACYHEGRHRAERKGK